MRLALFSVNNTPRMLDLLSFALLRVFLHSLKSVLTDFLLPIFIMKHLSTLNLWPVVLLHSAQVSSIVLVLCHHYHSCYCVGRPWWCHRHKQMWSLLVNFSGVRWWRLRKVFPKSQILSTSWLYASRFRYCVSDSALVVTSSQPISYPFKGSISYSCFIYFLKEYFMVQYIKGFAEIKCDHI